MCTENLNGEGSVDRSVRVDGSTRIDAGIVGVESRHLKLPAANATVISNLLAILSSKRYIIIL